MDLTCNCKNGSLIWGFPAHIHLASTYLIIGGERIQIYTEAPDYVKIVGGSPNRLYRGGRR